MLSRYVSTMKTWKQSIYEVLRHICSALSLTTFRAEKSKIHHTFYYLLVSDVSFWRAGVLWYWWISCIRCQTIFLKSLSAFLLMMWLLNFPHFYSVTKDLQQNSFTVEGCSFFLKRELLLFMNYFLFYN